MHWLLLQKNEKMTFMKIVKRTCRTETHKDELIEYHFVTLSYETEFEVTLKAINFAIEKKKHFTGI